MLRATCYVLRATCYVLRATCDVLCNVLRATCNVLCDVPPAQPISSYLSPAITATSKAARFPVSIAPFMYPCQ